MDAARWERIQELFLAAAELPEGARREWLASACRGDATLLAEVTSLLEADEGGHATLDRGVASLAADVLDEPARVAGPGRRFGPYRVLEVLGEGGMGVVYLAERDDLHSLAAIKVLRDAWLSPARRERFAMEQRTLAQLSHPAIARLYDAGALPDGTPYFVMEHVRGVPLTEYCRRNDCPIPERLALFRQVCEAVLHAHHHAVLHRDLKPSNILVTDGGEVKLLDFGIAKQLESLDAPSDRTRTGLRLMTPAYAAPEQIRGERVGLHTDVYSLGIILYELLTGRLPFDLEHHTPAEVETIVARHDPVRPSAVALAAGRSAGTSAARALGRTSWADLDVLCLAAMHKDPARRYRTVDALMRDVDHYLAGDPLEARPDSLGYRVGKFVRRHRTGVAAAGLGLAFVSGLVGFYTVRVTRARNAAVAQAARTQRIQGFMLGLFQGGDDAVGPAESLRVVTLLDRGVEESRNLDRDPAVRAELLHTLGDLYQKVGNLSRAETLLTTALEERRALRAGHETDVARSLVALGLLRAEEARYDDAERLIREGLDLARRSAPPGDPSIDHAMAALGHVLQQRGKYDDAIAVQQSLADRLALSAPGSAEQASALSALAGSHFYAGRFDVSDSINTIVLAMSRRLHGANHPLVAEDLVNLGATRFERGEYPAAERYYREALAISEKWYGPDHPKVAAHATMLGRALVYQERYDEGEAELRRSLAIRERVYGPDHPMVASTVNELGNIAVKQERLDEAEAHYKRMVSIYRTAYQDRHYLIGIAEGNLAGVYLARGDPARAEPLYRDAVRRYAETQGPEHMNTGIGRIKLGRALLRSGKYADAARESLAGYEIVSRQASPGVSFLKAARRDLIAAFDSLGTPERSAQFRAEIADSSDGIAR